LTGHCGYFIDCERWRTGCGNCPDLARPPAIRRDSTGDNWRRKQAIYRQSRLAVSTPSRWLMDCVEQSMLRPWQARVIPNGVDLDIYHPGDRVRERAALGIPQDAFVIVVSAYGGAGANPYKDFETIRSVIRRLAIESPSDTWRLICLGGQAQSQDEPNTLFTGYLSDPRQVARYYRCADVFLHAANAENHPLVILEAMACGTPVVATGVGGIPEQIVEGDTGFVTPRGDSEALVQRLHWLMQHPTEHRGMSVAAAARARQSFSLTTQAETFLTWFSALRREVTS
jgi:glycosyltransferase involved in cell wall biosynthesis